MIATVLWLLYDFLYLKNDVNVPSESNKQKNFCFKLIFCWVSWRSVTKIAGSGSDTMLWLKWLVSGMTGMFVCTGLWRCEPLPTVLRVQRLFRFHHITRPSPIQQRCLSGLQLFIWTFSLNFPSFDLKGKTSGYLYLLYVKSQKPAWI